MTGKSESAIDEEDESCGISSDNVAAAGYGTAASGLKRSRSINQSCVNLKRNFTEHQSNLQQLKTFDVVMGGGMNMITSRNMI